MFDSSRPPDAANLAAYVAATAPLVGLTLDAERQARVTAALALVIRTAAPAFAVPITPATEPAPVYRP